MPQSGLRGTVCAGACLQIARHLKILSLSLLQACIKHHDWPQERELRHPVFPNIPVSLSVYSALCLLMVFRFPWNSEPPIDPYCSVSPDFVF